MNIIEFNSFVEEYDTAEELPEKDQVLIREARKSMKEAYAPYSQFYVGAAVLLENGVTILGNNQENASYPISLCAERVAIFAAGANHPGVKIKAVAVCARSVHYHVNKPISPCGACRQAIAEYEHRFGGKIRVLMTGETGKIHVADSISVLLPFQFTADDLKPVVDE